MAKPPQGFAYSHPRPDPHVLSLSLFLLPILPYLALYLLSKAGFWFLIVLPSGFLLMTSNFLLRGSASLRSMPSSLTQRGPSSNPARAQTNFTFFVHGGQVAISSCDPSALNQNVYNFKNN